MKIVFTDDNDKTTVFQNITDVYFAVRQQVPVANKETAQIAMLPETRSFSWGSNIRELAKEVQQSLVELQDVLRSQRHGGNPS